MSRAAGIEPVDWPEALEPLRALASPAVATELSRLCVRAQSEQEADLTAEDIALIARPFRYMVDLAGDDALTSAGWMKPTYVQQIYTDLGFDEDWYGKGNREDQVGAVTEL
ncbi:hypothetical protein FNH13_15540 [Ornithinimicrobium ciconiae]|uniref:Uncharacterized protein n=1 Tax=Ornithinimicrobium ciconiae TaxID=2594265 RepID=A0A516GDG9_9MICO|nr:hypothetical protein [Ornithinimicrobium ciconiae]QDO89569.1 hypothetical protein FNH13_15540 [Ornithinimicrobium ciconiae]